MSAVRGYAEVGQDCVAAAVGCDEDIRHVLLREAAALLAEVAATLPDCPTCGGTGNVTPRYRRRSGVVYATTVKGCPDCDYGKVTVAQMAALWRRVWMFPVEERAESTWAYDEGWRACIDHLRAVMT